MSEYYAVVRSGDNELAHYGIKGMKWGVRKAIQSGNSRALGRQYKKAAKKLAKLEKRGANGKKYAARAAKLGAAAAAAGGLAVAGTSGVAKGLKAAGSAIGRAGYKSRGKLPHFVDRAAGTTNTALTNASKAVDKWGKGMTRTGITKTHNGITSELYLKNGGAARLAAGAVGAGLAAAAGRNAYKAATAKRNRKKAEQFRAEMNKAFAGTQYANKTPKQSSGSAKKKERKYFTKSDFKQAAKTAALSTLIGAPAANMYYTSKKAANSIPANNNRHGKKRSRR